MKFETAIQEKLGYYVYALVDPRDKKIFYIGKGVGDRVFSHATAALSSSNATDKLDKIREIIDNGNTVTYYIIRHNLTEHEAYLVESTLINFLTYKDFNLDYTLTNIVAGYHQDADGIKSLKELQVAFGAEKIEFEEGDKILMVNLNKSWNETKSIYDKRTPYEITRGSWKLGKRREAITHVLGVYRGLVIEVIKVKPEDWHPAPDIPERWQCNGEELKDSPYMGKSVEDYPFGSGNPIRYINC